MFCGLLITHIVLSVTSQVVQVGFCVAITRTQFNRKVFLPKGLHLLGKLDYHQSLLGTIGASVYSLVGLSGRDVSLCWHIALCPQGSCVITQCVSIFNFCASFCLFISQNPCICLFLNTSFSIICAHFTIPIFINFLYISLILSLSTFLVTSSYPCSCYHVMVLNIVLQCNDDS